MSGFTKEIIAKTFTELLDEKPMSKITVKDIVERCGVNRNTFYYHFKDIPDVVEFILKKKWDEILEHPQDRASILECMEEMADLVRNNRKVMLNVYRSFPTILLWNIFGKMQISLILMREKSGF